MESTQSPDIRSLCELCKTLDCCPEHCCNWDTCTCNDCEHCRNNKASFGQTTQANIQPSILIRSTGQEEITKVKKSKSKKVEEEVKASEQIRTHDGALIINYEIAQEEEEVVYHGGVRGIRALRQQRDALNTQIEEFLDHENTDAHKFSKYEEKKR